MDVIRTVVEKFNVLPKCLEENLGVACAAMSESVTSRHVSIHNTTRDYALYFFEICHQLPDCVVVHASLVHLGVVSLRELLSDLSYNPGHI